MTPYPLLYSNPLTPTVDLGGPKCSRQCPLLAPSGDLGNHQNHYRGPAKSSRRNHHHDLEPSLQFNGNHCFHEYSNAKWTLKIIIFHIFSKKQKPRIKTQKRNYQFRTRISTVFSSWDSPIYAFRPSIFQKNR